jgi:hypothetical protein
MISLSSKIKISAAVLLLALFTVNCKGGQVKEENAAVKDRSFGLDEANSVLTDLSYSPYGKGFEYKNTTVPSSDFESWFTKFSPQINQAVSAIGSGFVLQVTGHTCSRGPREAVPAENKLGNMHYSKVRGDHVYEALIKSGIAKENMTVTGIADDEPLPGIDTADQKNRRVTFKIVPAPAK